jgi:apolipoprotein D and lipocalin family protein
MKILCVCLLIAATVIVQTSAEPSATFVPVNNFSLEKYLGAWYEIARMPVSFEKDLVNVTATYELRKDGKVNVTNLGYKNGDKKVARAIAKFAESPNVGHLRVTFFWPFCADYTIVALDSNYTYAMVAGKSHKYLWILSRTPKLDKEVIDNLLAKAIELGFDATKLIMVEQE